MITVGELYFVTKRMLHMVRPYFLYKNFVISEKCFVEDLVGFP